MIKKLFYLTALPSIFCFFKKLDEINHDANSIVSTEGLKYLAKINKTFYINE